MKTATKERPILFSAPMIRAILDGRKTQTRRILKMPKGGYIEDGIPLRHVGGDYFNAIPCPYGERGDRLWVRETWQAYDGGSFKTAFGVARTFSREPKLGDTIEFKADKDLSKCFINWRPSIHMPRWASRITLEVTEVRVERVQEITEEDAKAEGVRAVTKDSKVVKYCVYDQSSDTSSTAWQEMPNSARGAFKTLWDKLNAPRGFGWDANPWVWVVSFKRVEQEVRA